jgi:hypothetical protein
VYLIPLKIQASSMVTQISDFGVTMLDAWIFKGIRYTNTKVLDHAPFTKPTARHVPLAPSSAHPKAVHVSWPRGELKRVRRLCIRKEQYAVYSARMVRRWLHFFIQPPPTGAFSPSKPKPAKAENPVSRSLRLVLRYHPAFAGLGYSLENLCSTWRPVFHGVGGERLSRLRIQVAYRAASRSLATQFRGT